MNVSKLIIVCSALLFTLQATSAVKPGAVEKKEDNRNPSGCRDTGYEFDLKTIRLLPSASGGGMQSMYFMFNFSGQTVNLYQMRDEESSRSIYLNHALGANQWGAFATSENQVKYICTVPKQGSTYGQIVDCSQHLRVCEFTNVKFGLNNQGNYWLVNSSSRNAAVREVVRYGIIPAL